MHTRQKWKILFDSNDVINRWVKRVTELYHDPPDVSNQNGCTIMKSEIENLNIIELAMYVSHVLDRKLLERLMSPSPKSQVMFASAFS